MFLKKQPRRFLELKPWWEVGCGNGDAEGEG